METKRIIAIYVTILVAFTCFAQEGKMVSKILEEKYEKVYFHQVQEYGGYCQVKMNNKWGAFCVKNMKEVIPCKYDDICIFQLAERPFCQITLDGKKGCYDINLQKEIVPCKYDDIREFEFKDMDVCRIEINHKCGLVDKEGNEIVACQYDDMGEGNLQNYDYCLVIKDGCYGIINKEGREIISPAEYSYLNLEYYNKTPIVAVVQKGSLIKRGYFDEGCVYHDPEYIRKGKCGVVELKTGKEIIPCQYDDIIISDEKLYTFNIGGEKPTIIKIENQTAQGGKWGVIDSSNKVVIPADYDAPIVFKDEVAQVLKME